MSFFSELQRRNVFKAAVAYAAACWLLLQIADLVLEGTSAPGWVMQAIMLAMAVGFPVAIVVAWVFEVTPEGVKLQKNVDRNKSITKYTGRQLNRGIVVILSVAMVFLLTERFRDETSFWSSEGDTSPAVVGAGQETADAREPGAKPVPREISIGILPFINVSTDREQDNFTEDVFNGIHDALVNADGLTVADRTSASAFKGDNLDLLEIGEFLQVRYILAGSVRSSGSGVRITVQLTRAEDGIQVWTHTYDREMYEALIIQDEISTKILTLLKNN